MSTCPAPNMDPYQQAQLPVTLAYFFPATWKILIVQQQVTHHISKSVICLHVLLFNLCEMQCLKPAHTTTLLHKMCFSYEIAYWHTVCCIATTGSYTQKKLLVPELPWQQHFSFNVQCHSLPWRALFGKMEYMYIVYMCRNEESWGQAKCLHWIKQ